MKLGILLEDDDEANNLIKSLEEMVQTYHHTMTRQETIYQHHGFMCYYNQIYQ